MLVDGKMTRRMDKGHILQKTELTMTAAGRQERRRAKPLLRIPTNQHTMAYSSMTRNQATGYTPRMMAGNTMENGKPARKMVQASRLMQTAKR